MKYIKDYLKYQDTKLNINHFKRENIKTLKYLLFGFKEKDFEQEYFHQNGLFTQKHLKINYYKLNEFIESLNSYELQIINLERKNETYKYNSDKLKTKYNVIYLVFYKKNRQKYNITFRFVFKEDGNYMYYDLIKKIENQKYFKKWNSSYFDLNYNFIEKLKVEAKQLYKNFDIISYPYYNVKSKHEYQQTFYKVKNGSDLFKESILLSNFILYNICNEVLSIDSINDSWFGRNPLNLTLPIKRLPLIGLPGVISNELPEKINKLIDFRGDINKLQNQYVKPIFDIGLTKYVI